LLKDQESVHDLMMPIIAPTDINLDLMTLDSAHTDLDPAPTDLDSAPTGIGLDPTTIDPAPTTLAINHALPLQIEGDQQREVILF